MPKPAVATQGEPSVVPQAAPLARMENPTTVTVDVVSGTGGSPGMVMLGTPSGLPVSASVKGKGVSQGPEGKGVSQMQNVDLGIRGSILRGEPSAAQGKGDAIGGSTLLSLDPNG